MMAVYTSQYKVLIHALFCITVIYIFKAIIPSKTSYVPLIAHLFLCNKTQIHKCH